VFIERPPMASVRSGSGTSAPSRWLMRAKTITVSGTRKRGTNVCYWPKADMSKNAINVAFGAKADIIIPDPWAGGTKQNVWSEEPRSAEVRQESLDAFAKCVSGRQW